MDEENDIAGVTLIMDEMMETGLTSYAEKHRLYEIFGNMAKALAMSRPADPLKFIAWFLKHRRHRNVPKVILIAPPTMGVDKVYAVINVAKSIGAVTIDRRNVMSRRQKKRGSKSTDDFIISLVEYMRAKGAAEKGWILLGIPNSEKEADRMINLGILPTHTIVLKSDDSKDAVGITFDNINGNYKNLEDGIKRKFQTTLKEICVLNKSVAEMTDLCMEQILLQPSTSAPFTPRITMICPKGSGQSVMASEVAEKLNVIHVDFNQILIQKNIDCDGAIDDVPTETLHSWIKEKISTPECVKKGYVLTGFPRTRNDFEWLDSIEMAPNRVIFLVINFRKICVNVKNRCIDLNTGSFKSLDQAAKELKLGTSKIEHLELYPFDFQRLLCHFKTYCNGLKEMLCYCGDDCFIVSVDESFINKISACVNSGNPAVAIPRPQNRMPSRLTESLYEKMLLSYLNISNIRLSEEAENLLNVLEQKA